MKKKETSINIGGYLLREAPREGKKKRRTIGNNRGKKEEFTLSLKEKEVPRNSFERVKGMGNRQLSLTVKEERGQSTKGQMSDFSRECKCPKVEGGFFGGTGDSLGNRESFTSEAPKREAAALARAFAGMEKKSLLDQTPNRRDLM